MSEKLESEEVVKQADQLGADKLSGAVPNRGGSFPRKWMPSTSWFVFIYRLLKKVGWKERLILMAGLTLPAVGRATNIGSFGVAVKAINMATQEDLSQNQIYIITSIVLAVFVLAGLIRTAAGRVELAIEGIALKIVRGIVADQLIALQKVPEELRNSHLKKFVRSEKQFVRNSAGLLTDLITFISLILVLVLLLGLISWVAPPVALVLIAGVISILFTMRLRIHAPIRSDKKAGKRANKELLKIREQLASGDSETDKLVNRYLKNSADRLEAKKEKSKKTRKGKITILSGISSALAMATALLLAARGDFAEFDHSILIVMILSLRLAAGQGRTAMEKWSTLLGERESLGQLRRMVDAGRGRVVPLMEMNVDLEENARDREKEDE